MITKEDMINSLDAGELQRKSISNIVCLIIVLMIVLAYCAVEYQPNIFPAALFIVLLLTCPLLICAVYYQNKRKNIINNYEKYVEYTTVLDVSNPSLMYKYYVYYTVSFEHNGKKKTVDTYPLFGRGLFVKYRNSDYRNQKVRIAYNEQEDKVVVLSLVD